MKAVITLISAVLAGAALLIGLPYLLPLAGPFLIAFTAAAVMEPVVCALHRRGVPRSLAAGIVTILVLLVLGILLTLTVTNSVNALMTFAKRTPDLLETLSAALTDLQQRVLGLIRKAPEGVVEQLTIALEAVAGELYAVPAWLSEKLLGLVAGIAKRSPDLLLFTATTAIGVYFFSASYRDIMDFLQRQLPPKTRKKARHAWAGLRGAASIVFAIMVVAMGGSISYDLFHIVFMVSLFSVAIQGTLLPWISGKLSMVDETVDVRKTFNDYQETSAITMMQMKIPAGHNWENKVMKEVCVPTGSLALMIKRGKETIIPRGNTMILADDTIIFSVPAYEAAENERLEEIRIDRGHLWCGRCIYELDLKNLLIALIIRGDESLIPDGKTTIREGDVVVLYR